MTSESFIWEKLFMKGEASTETIILKTSRKKKKGTTT